MSRVQVVDENAQQQEEQAEPVHQYFTTLPEYPEPPPQAAPPSFWAGVHPLVYVGVGVVLSSVVGKIFSLVTGGPGKLQQMVSASEFIGGAWYDLSGSVLCDGLNARRSG